MSLVLYFSLEPDYLGSHIGGLFLLVNVGVLVFSLGLSTPQLRILSLTWADICVWEVWLRNAISCS